MLALILSWLAWCGLHSLLITATVRRWFEKRGGIWLGCYRLGYVLLAIATLLPLLWYTRSLPQQSLGTPPLWLQMGQFLLFIYAAVMFIGGIRVYDLGSFLGLRQWRDFRSGRKTTPAVFLQSGILRYIRHPWYSGGIALLWSLPNLTDVSLVIRTILTGYLICGTLLEERKLKENLGSTYQAYRRRAPMLIPWKPKQ
jgi:protein-S-isoprenylcysteine O-methyltransferase Ste14